MLFRSVSQSRYNAKPLRVLVIDAGTPEVPYKYSVMGRDLSEKPTKDTRGHSSCVYQMVVTGQSQEVSCLNMKVDWCTWYLNVKTSAHYYYDCLSKAVDGDYDIVNLSLNGSVYDRVEESYINMLRKKSMVIIAAGNDGCEGLKKCGAYPSQYSKGSHDSILAIAALTKTGERAKYSNYETGLTIFFLHIQYIFIIHKYFIM